MADLAAAFSRFERLIRRHRSVVLPVCAAMLIFVILVPLPPALMDMLLAGSIALAVVMLLTTLYVSSPLEFSVFPSALLGATLFRLVLNVATTRLILTAGADGRGISQAQFAAGRVIWAFSRFVTSGSLAVGVIIFAILVLVQFIVVTRGAARISEVAARFVLDAMPGKQMAIDADLNASLIDQRQARQRRRRIEREADFYGAMDGASKFLRGDAVAAVLITLVNILGGLYVGIVQYGWPWSRTVELFTRLTIGDGLVAQVPAFIVSVSAALIVARSTSRSNLSEELIGQLTARPVVLIIAGVFLGALALTSLPKAPLLLIAAGCIGLALLLPRRSGSVEKAADGPAPHPASQDAEDIRRLLAVDPLKIELGYNLVPLTAPDRRGNLLQRIADLRREIATELGFVFPQVRVCDNMRLPAYGYVINIRGGKVASGRIYPGRVLAVGGDAQPGQLAGDVTFDPRLRGPAVWVGPEHKRRAELLNCTIVAAPDVLIRHLGQIVRSHAGDLLSRRQVDELLENLKARAPGLVAEATERLKVARIQKLLQGLLGERVSIRDLETILETACDQAVGAGAEKLAAGGVEPLVQQARSALARTLSQQYCGRDGKLRCVCLESKLEQELGSYVGDAPADGAGTIPPDIGGKVARALTEGLGRLRQQGYPPVVLCAPTVRAALRRLITPALPETAVLGYNEVDSVKVLSVANVGIEL